MPGDNNQKDENNEEEITVYDYDHSEKSSSNIRQARYRPHQKKLNVVFQNGSEYEYDEVPQDVIDDWMKADSLGSYHYNHIRTAFPYHQV